jgi:type VI secretion system protein ImpC
VEIVPRYGRRSLHRSGDARVLGRLPYGPDTVPVRSFNYVEEVKGPDHDKYLWTNASFAFASNMVRSFINNGWCVQIRGPQAGGAVQDLPIHLYDWVPAIR